jgi:hypothetical protein
MNGRISKKLRKMIYGDKPTNREGRKYSHIRDGNGVTIVCRGERASYQDAKKDYVRGI